MSDDETKDKLNDDVDQKVDTADEISPDGEVSLGEDATDNGKAEEVDELPEKSDIDRELERVESIETKTYSADSDTTEYDSSEDGTDTDEDTSETLHDDTEKDDASDGVSSPSITTFDKSEPMSLPLSLPEDNNKKVNLDDIIKRNKVEEKAQKKPIVWIVLAVVFLLAAAAFGGLYYNAINSHDTKLDSLKSDVGAEQAKNQQLTAQLTEAQKKLADKIDAEQKDKEAAEKAAAIKYREIPEWGVRYKLTDANKDLTYAFAVVTEGKTSTERLGFSTKQISAIEDKENPINKFPCSSEATPAGWILRYTKEELDAVKKTAKGTDTAALYDKAVKNGEYYYVAGTSQAACSPKLGTATNINDVVAVVQDLPNKFEAIPTK